MIHLLILARQNAGVDRAFRDHARARSQECYRRSSTERMRGVTVRTSGRPSGKSMWQIVQVAMQGWSRHRVASLGAALAYYSVFSLGPLLLIVTATAGILFGENAVRGELTNQFRGLLGPTGGQAIDAMLKGAANPQTGTLAAVTGVVLLLVAAVAVVVQLKEALNTIWEVDTAAESGWRPYLHTYLVSFAGVLGLGFLLAVSLVINAVLAAGASTLRVSGTEAVLWEALNFSVSLIVLSALFGLLFKWFPDTEVSWSEVVPGAVATAILFNLGKMAIGWYIGREGLEFYLRRGGLDRRASDLGVLLRANSALRCGTDARLRPQPPRLAAISCAY